MRQHRKAPTQSPRPSEPGAARQIIQDFLHVLRHQFYADQPKAFYQERGILIRAITWPAAYLAKRGVGLTETDHRQLLTDQIRAIQHHGNTTEIRYFCRYFLHVIQQHMKFHGEDYYDSGKGIRALASGALDSLQAKAAAAALDTTDRLAEIHAAISIPKRRRKATASPQQLEFL